MNQWLIYLLISAGSAALGAFIATFISIGKRDIEINLAAWYQGEMEKMRREKATTIQWYDKELLKAKQEITAIKKKFNLN